MNEMLKESYDNFSMHILFHKIYTNAKTCVLKIYFPENIIKTVYFSEGNIVFASSNAEKDKLVNILLKYKKINQEQLDIVLKQMDKSISLGRNLVNMGFITHKELIWAVKVQIVGIIHSIIVSKTGEYSINEGPLPEGVINLPLNTLKIIFDSLVMFKDREWIAKEINAPDAVYKKTILFEEGKTKLLSNEELEKIADSIDGEKTLTEIAGLSNIEDFKTFKLIYALKFLNLIEEKVDEVPATEELFKIEDEPEENIEFAESFTAKVADVNEEEVEKFEENIEEKLEEENGEDVFIEFDIEENSSIEISESDDESEEIEEEQGDEDKDGIKLTEEDLDSVIIDDDVAENKTDLKIEESEEIEVTEENNVVETAIEINEDDEATQQIENAQEIVEEIISEKEEDPDKTVLSANINDLTENETNLDETETETEIDSDETIDNEHIKDEEDDEDYDLVLPKDKSSNALLYTLIFILIIVVGGYGYYKFYYSKGILIPGQKTVNDVKKEDTVNVKKQPDITENEVSNLSDAENNDLINQGNNEEPDIPEDLKKEVPEKQENTTDINNEANKSIEPLKEDVKKSENIAENNSNKNKLKTEENKEIPTETITKPNVDKKSIKASNNEPKGDLIEEESVSEFSIEDILSRSNENMLNNENGYTIRIEFACLPETIKTAYDKAEEKDKLILVPRQLKRGTCYFVCYGVFDTISEAESELNRLHEIFFQDGNKPFVTPITQFTKYIK